MMNSVRRSASRVLSACLEASSNQVTTKIVNRSFASLSKCVPKVNNNAISALSVRGIQTKGDKELFEFLQTEITDEKKNMMTNIPSKIGEFNIIPDRAFLTFERKFNDEVISISVDVNHSVDAEGPADTNENSEGLELKSRPNFEIGVKKGERTLSFTCSFLGAEEQDPQQQDAQQQDAITGVFGINEITLFDVENSEEDYCVSGDIIDETLYDLFLNFLEERGVTEEFAEQMSDFCSDYEHSLYVNLIQKVQDFIKK